MERFIFVSHHCSRATRVTCYINVTGVTASSNHRRYLVKCAAAFGRVSKRAICPPYCAGYPRRVEREPIRYRDRCLTRSRYSDERIAGGRDRKLVVRGREDPVGVEMRGEREREKENAM